MKTLSIEPRRKVWVTSDLHLGHANILKFCPNTRRGQDADEMSALIVEAWNRVVAPEDVVINLGDVAFKKAALLKYLPQLNGEHHVVLGNHDEGFESLIAEHVASVSDALLLKTELGKFFCSHYPHEEWYRRALHLHGHVHGSGKPAEGRLDVGVDARGDNLMEPMSLAEVRSRMDKGASTPAPAPQTETKAGGKLTLVRGLPGSGKSTYARSLGVMHLENDMFLISHGEYKWSREAARKAHARCVMSARSFMESGADLVVSNTFVKTRDMKAYRKAAEDFGYQVEVHTCRGNYGSIHNVPETDLQRIANSWQEMKEEA